MQVLFLLCAESMSLDQRRNTLSVFNIVEEWNIPAFPFVIPYVAIVALFSRNADEPENPEGMQIRISLGNQDLFTGPLGIRFQGRMRMRAITDVGGLVLPNPGLLTISILSAEQRSIASWPIVINNIGQPTAQPELPLGRAN